MAFLRGHARARDLATALLFALVDLRLTCVAYAALARMSQDYVAMVRAAVLGTEAPGRGLALGRFAGFSCRSGTSCFVWRPGARSHDVWRDPFAAGEGDARRGAPPCVASAPGRSNLLSSAAMARATAKTISDRTTTPANS